ncbi:MAG: DNA repair exonuclease [Nitrospirales bacterium]|nr:DNA repair exonuclease [Nitrospirales bacterium]
MFKFIHTADIHLDSPLRGLSRYEGAPVEQVRAASRQAFGNMVRLAIDEKVSFVLISGDLFDGDWKDYNTALFLSKEMSRLREQGIQVFIISGNHDATSQISRTLRMPENVTKLSTSRPQSIVMEEIGVAIHGQGFASRSVTDDLASAYPQAISGFFNIGMLHTSLTGREGHEPYAPCKVETLLSKNYDYWALGHVHKREVVYEEPWIVFPGNIQGRHIGEAGPKGCSLVTVADGRVLSVGHVDTDLLRWVLCPIDAAGADTAEAVVERVCSVIGSAAEDNGNLPLAVRLVISGRCKAHGDIAQDQEKWVNEIRAAAADLTGGAVWIEKVRIGTGQPVGPEAGMEADDALADLLRCSETITVSGDLPASFIDDFNGLKAKLPTELFQGEDSLDLEEPGRVRQLIEDAAQMVVSRLLSEGGTL